MFSVLSGYEYTCPINSLRSRFLSTMKYPDFPAMTFIYGKRHSFSSYAAKGLQKVNPLNVTVEEVDGAGHHVHAEKSGKFDELMTIVFQKADAKRAKVL